MQDSGAPAKFPIVFASGAAGANITTPIPNTSSTLGRASLTLGFPPACFTPIAAGGSWPFGQDFNGILNETTAWLQWLQAGAPVGYDSAFSTAIGGYPKGASIRAASGTGQYWISTTDNNTTDPDTGGAGWVSLASFAFPTGQGPSIASSGTATSANAGQICGITGTATLNAAGFAAFQTIGFNVGGTAAVLTTTSGSFYGAPNIAFSGTITLPAGSNFFVQWDGVNWRVLAKDFGTSGRLLNIQGFSTAGTSTYTPTSGATRVVCYLVGGGGAGGGAPATGASQYSTGGGGGSGALCWFQVMNPTSATVVIGAGGVGASGGAGGNGGSSSFGGTFTAAGGNAAAVGGPSSAGFVAQPGGGGARGSTANLLDVGGNPGTSGITLGTAPLGGVGAASVLFGGAGFGSSASTGGNATAPGAGGGGSSNVPSAAAQPGGSGGAGQLIVWEYS
jgi:hypothetical protein